MTTLVFRRESFTQPERLSPAWTLTKASRNATCEVWSHEFGFELRALIDADLVQSHVCRSQDELIRVQENGARCSKREAGRDDEAGRPAR